MRYCEWREVVCSKDEDLRTKMIDLPKICECKGQQAKKHQKISIAWMDCMELLGLCCIQELNHAGNEKQAVTVCT